MMRNGREIEIRDMDDGHLHNAFDMMIRNGYDDGHPDVLGLGVEIIKRHLRKG